MTRAEQIEQVARSLQDMCYRRSTDPHIERLANQLEKLFALPPDDGEAVKPKTCERWCFAMFHEGREEYVNMWPNEKSAKEALAEHKEYYPDATFSAIVRVEFVEEKTA